MPPKNPPTVRQWKLIEILKKSKRGLTLAEIAGRLGMDDRTIRRDLAKLKKSGLSNQIGRMQKMVYTAGVRFGRTQDTFRRTARRV